MTESDRMDNFEVKHTRSSGKDDMAALKSDDLKMDLELDSNNYQPTNTYQKTNKQINQEESEPIDKKMRWAEWVLFLKNYSIWLIETAKHPLVITRPYQSVYLWLNFVLTFVLSALSTTLNLHAFYDKTLVNSNFSELASFVGFSTKNPISFGSFISLLFAYAILTGTYVFATWVGMRVLRSTRPLLTGLELYAGLFTPTVLIAVVGTLLALVRLNFLSNILIILGVMVVTFIFVYVIMTAENHLHLDDFYAKFLALLTTTVILVLISYFLIGIFKLIILKTMSNSMVR